MEPQHLATLSLTTEEEARIINAADQLDEADAIAYEHGHDGNVSLIFNGERPSLVIQRPMTFEDVEETFRR